MPPASDIIELNVGGEYFSTTRSTLCGDHLEPHGTMLSAMFGSAALPTQLDRDGRVFIDRDGPRFRMILNYLRSGVLLGVTTGPATLEEMLEEAIYFGLQRLSTTLREEIAAADLEDDLEALSSSQLSQPTASEDPVPDAALMSFSSPAGSPEQQCVSGLQRCPSRTDRIRGLDYTFTLNADF
jgi:BTB/POZ domain